MNSRICYGTTGLPYLGSPNENVGVTLQKRLWWTLGCLLLFASLSGNDFASNVSVPGVPLRSFENNLLGKNSGHGPYSLLFRTDSGNAASPRAAGNYVVWRDWRDQRSAIYAYDIERNTEVRLSRDECGNFDPDISGHLVVWARLCSTGIGMDQYRSSIVVYNLDLSTEVEIYSHEGEPGTRPGATSVDGGGRDASPRSDGRYVVWLSRYGNCPSCRGPRGTPMAHDLETDDTWEIGREDAALLGIGLWNGLAWWAEGVYDLDARQMLPLSLDILGSADEGLIVRKEDSLLECDPISGESTFLVNVTGRQAMSLVHPDGQSVEMIPPIAYSAQRRWLIWAMGTPGSLSLVLHEIESGEVQELTSPSDYEATNPTLSGDILAWEARTPRSPGKANDIYIARLR